MARNFLALLLAGLAVAACQNPDGPVPGAGAETTSGATQAAARAASPAGLNPALPCPSGETATLRSGVQVQYDGAAPDRPDFCAASWGGTSHQLLRGFWTGVPGGPTDANQQAALQTALAGPVGTIATFTLPHRTRFQLWSDAEIRHVANDVITLQGASASQARAVIKLDVVLHDALHRPNIAAETVYWIDAETGILLRRQSITHMANGHVLDETNWDVVTLRGLRL